MAKLPSFKDVGRAMGFEFSEGENVLNNLNQILKNLNYYKTQVGQNFLNEKCEYYPKVTPEPINGVLLFLPKEKRGQTTSEDMFRLSIYEFIDRVEDLAENSRFKKNDLIGILSALKDSINQITNAEVIEKLRHVRQDIFNLIEDIK
jgi:hypothetical protein